MSVAEQIARTVEWAEAKAARSAVPVESVELRPFQTAVCEGGRESEV